MIPAKGHFRWIPLELMKCFDGRLAIFVVLTGWTSDKVFIFNMLMWVLLQIDKKLMKTSGMVARVINEVEIHWQLKHPSIVEVQTVFFLSYCTLPLRDLYCKLTGRSNLFIALWRSTFLMRCKKCRRIFKNFQRFIVISNLTKIFAKFIVWFFIILIKTKDAVVLHFESLLIRGYFFFQLKNFSVHGNSHFWELKGNILFQFFQN